FEAITASDGPLLSAFMTNLYQDFKRYNKTVAMAVPPKARDVNTGWAGAYTYSDLRAWADYFIIMAYDQHFTNGSPGPIASLPWLNDIANYASNTLGSQKIIWGIGVYGYDWNTSYYPAPPAQPRTWAETQQLAQQYNNGGGFSYDYVNQAPSLVYVADHQR